MKHITRTLFVVLCFVVLSDQCTNEKWLPFTGNEHIAALVLARGGSQSIPLKNLAVINGQTLLNRSLIAIHKSKLFNSIWVSTDHHQIAEEAETGGAAVHWREENTATNEASSIIAVQEFIRHHRQIDIVALIQCTSPFLKAKYLNEATSLFSGRKNLECVFSSKKTYKLRWSDANGRLRPLNFNLTKRPRRQDWKGELVENGMFYIAKRSLIERGVFQTEKLSLNQSKFLFISFPF